MVAGIFPGMAPFRARWSLLPRNLDRRAQFFDQVWHPIAPSPGCLLKPLRPHRWRLSFWSARQREFHMITSTDRVLWPVGLRVSRKDTNELGTVVEHDGESK